MIDSSLGSECGDRTLQDDGPVNNPSTPSTPQPALDVWCRYPTGPGPTLPAQHPFQELPNVLMTPHVSGWTEGMMEARATLIADNIHRAARGEPPVNLISPSE